MKRKVRISCIEGTRSKLALVKMIKEFSNLGLKDSKDIVDRIHYTLSIPVEFELSENKTTLDLINELKNIDGKFLVNGGTQWQRAKKMLDLGIGTEEEYSEFISEYIVNNMYDDPTKSIEFLKSIFSKFDKGQLESIFKNLKINDSNL